MWIDEEYSKYEKKKKKKTSSGKSVFRTEAILWLGYRPGSYSMVLLEVSAVLFAPLQDQSFCERNFETRPDELNFKTRNYYHRHKSHRNIDLE